MSYFVYFCCLFICGRTSFARKSYRDDVLELSIYISYCILTMDFKFNHAF